MPLPVGLDEPAQFPKVPPPYDVISIRIFVESIEVGVTSLVPRLGLWFYQTPPNIRRAFQRKDSLLDIAFNEADARFNGDTDST
jgi:hypothetical protein